MKNFHLFLVIGAVLQLLAHGAPITDGGVCHTAYEVCNNPECTKEAEDILKDLKPHLNPCDDFEQFSCGGFFDNATNPNDGTWRYSYPVMLTKMDKKTNEILHELVNATDPKTPKPDPKDQVSIRNIQRMHDNFAACMDEAQLSKAGSEPLMRQLDQVVQLYPVPDSPIQPKKAPGVTIKKDGITGQFLRNGWTSSVNLPMEHTGVTGGNNKGNLSAIIGQFLRNGFEPLITLTTKPFIAEPTQNQIHLSLGGGSLKLYKDSPDQVQAYERFIGEMFYIFYDPKKPAIGRNGTAPLVVPPLWKDVAKNVLDFEKALIALVTSEMGYRQPTIALMNELTPSLDWNLILRRALPSDVKAPEVVVVAGLEFFEGLNKLLDDTKPRTIQLVFAWSMIFNFAEFLDVAHRRPFDDFKRAVSGKSSERIQICTDNTLKNVPDVVGHYLVKVAFPQQARTKVEEIINATLNAYSKSFQEYDWLDKITRDGALAKINHLARKIGYSYAEPDNSQPPSIDQFYSELKLDGRDHFGNQVRANIFRKQAENRKLYKPVDRMHMLRDASQNNAFYNPKGNDVNFPFGTLQSPLFNVDFPEYLNYGAFGASTGGHEITHAFDDDGIKWDYSGHYKSWMSEDSLKEFKKRTQCLIYQYGNFSMPGPGNTTNSLNGLLTLTENIADNGGIKQTYKAWFELYLSDPQSKKYNNKRLPKLEEYSPEQMFFIQFARSWCTKFNPAYVNDDLNAEHAPSKYRIMGVLQNSQDFANAFKCKPGSKMNPLKTEKSKCDLW
ncbi:MAG: hypothetical protein J3Q66DRAFT_383130 [Benniella sp.]|nr:MAG: hypothetical protein J3Q66DRAFT_383130 [Benniella sp.]